MSLVPDHDHAEQRQMPTPVLKKLAQVCDLAERLRHELADRDEPLVSEELARLNELLEDVDVRAFRAMVDQDLLD